MCACVIVYSVCLSVGLCYDSFLLCELSEIDANRLIDTKYMNKPLITLDKLKKQKKTDSLSACDCNVMYGSLM